MASIRERNGKFNVIYSYTNEKGERKQKWETYETKAEAKRRKKEIEYKKEMGSFVVRKCKTLDELITEYVALYGKENWALSTYEGNVSLINNYILPIIGDAKLSEINTRFIERYYQSLLKRRAVINPLNKTSKNELVSASTIRDINKLLRNCFEQAVKWELMEKNPCIHATVPKHKSQKRDIWTADTLMYALSVCEDERLKLAINLSFSCSLQEIGMTNVKWKNINDMDDIRAKRTYEEAVGQGKDPDEVLAYFSELGRDNARTPMQWDDSENGGFTCGKPWIKCNDNYRTINAQSEVNDPDSLYNYYKRLIQCYHDHADIVRQAEFRPMYEEYPGLFAYEREVNGKGLLVIVNFTNEKLMFQKIDQKCVLCNYHETESEWLQPYEARIYSK